MNPLTYHQGQRTVQDEANTRRLADNLAHWNGPVAEFAGGADLILLASFGAEGALCFGALSGSPPLVEMLSDSCLRLLADDQPSLPSGPTGGLAINLGIARRVRLNGALSVGATGAILDLEEAFTLCRKYMAPSLTLGDVPHTGPLARRALALDDGALADAVREAETIFLASASPDGAPDVAHRGGPAGFVDYDSASGRLTWPEYLGDGVFKSAGNVRATARLTLLVPDFATGDAYELVCEDASYENLRASRHERIDALIQDRSPYPVQGVMESRVVAAYRLTALVHPRERVQAARKVTSLDGVHLQAPQ